MDKELLDRLIKNERSYNFLKIAEELNELSTALLQSFTKGVDDAEIIEEIGDVKMRLKVLEQYFDKELIKKRIEYKSEKYKKYINEKTYKNI